MSAEEIWRGKTDEDVLAAYSALGDFTDEGQIILRAEVERRQLTPTTLNPTIAREAADTAPVQAPRHPIARLWAGGYSLPMTYWVWGQFGTLVLGLLVVTVAPATTPATPFALAVGGIWRLTLMTYLVIVGVATWRSAGHYQGSPGWAMLARVAVLWPVGMFVLRAFAAALGPRTP